MKLFIQFFVLVVFLFFGVLLGIHTAEKGIYRISGTPDKPAQSFHITKIDDGKVEISVLGNRYKVENVDEITEEVQKKKEALEKQINEKHSRISQLGNWLGDWFRKLTRKGIDWLAAQV
ncbi:hypothetical protein BSNK01_04260 [Bacillaceae bacterium]